MLSELDVKHPSNADKAGEVAHPSVKAIWDLVNAIRQTTLNVPPMMGIATDDSHEYHGKPGSRQVVAGSWFAVAT